MHHLGAATPRSRTGWLDLSESCLQTGEVPEQTSTLDAARGGDQEAFALLIEPFRRELRAHCYRFSGSLHDADDLVQESLLRAWRGLKSFEGRSSLRTWLYKLATSACLDALEKSHPRGLPMDLGPAVTADTALAPPRLEPICVEPWPDAIGDEHVLSSPEARYSLRESVSLAFLVALQLGDDGFARPGAEGRLPRGQRRSDRGPACTLRGGLGNRRRRRAGVAPSRRRDARHAAAAAVASGRA